MKARVLALASVFVLALVATLLAHEVTYKGPVVSIDTKTVTVGVTDAKTKKTDNTVFGIDEDTKIFRADKSVTLAQAAIQKGEAISVTVNMDVDEHYAMTIKLAAKK